MRSVRKVVFPVAGLGTRLLPFTKAVPKEMMPIMGKPLIQYSVEEALNAGCKTLIFVTSDGKHAIKTHFEPNLELEKSLIKNGKSDIANDLRNILPSDVECIYVNQEEQLGLGHAVLCAEKVVGNDPFCVILPDDYIHAKNNQTVSKLIKAFQKTGCCQLSVMPVDGPNICKYGVIKPGKRSNQVYRLIEKPSLKMAPSKIASIGRYVFTPSLFQSIKSIGVGHGGELQLADAIDQLAQNGNVEMVYLEGSRFDCGTERGYLNAILHLADRRKRPRIETYENMAPIQESSECDEAFNIIDERFN
jgi:UTP--glucose-1-phosphate uridylyltransferase